MLRHFAGNQHSDARGDLIVSQKWRKGYEDQKIIELKDADGRTVKNAMVRVADNLSAKSIGNVSIYYLDANGNMLVGWQWIRDTDGMWYQYYFNEEKGSLFGALLQGGTRYGKTLDEKGRLVENGAVVRSAVRPAG